MHPCAPLLLAIALLGPAALAQGQTNPPANGQCNPQSRPGFTPPEPRTEEERQERERWASYREKLQTYLPKLPAKPDARLLMPVRDVRARSVADTFGAPRGGSRRHEGQDIFAPKGTPVYSATAGYVWRIGYGQRGGIFVYVVGAGGRRYYYAHLDRYASGLREGQKVSSATVLGYVGNTGNATTTPPHLHFGVYSGSRRTCDYKVINPLPLLSDRDWTFARQR